MALEMNDLVALKSLENGMSPYEQIKTQNMAAKSHTGGVAIAGLTVGVVGAVAGITAWIFGGMQASAKGNQAKEVAVAAKELASAQYTAALQLMNQQNQDTKANIDRLLIGLQRETDARVNGDTTISQTITDTISGQQSSSLTAQQQSELSAIQTATNTVTAGLMTGQYSQNPMKVVRVSGQRECPCDNGCGCQG